MLVLFALEWNVQNCSWNHNNKRNKQYMINIRCTGWPRSPQATSVAWRISSKMEQNCSEHSVIINDLATTCRKCTILYGKTRLKCITKRMPLCVNTAFSRICHKRVKFYRVLPCKTRISRICQNTRVLPCKSRIWAQKGPRNGPQNGPRIA